jgi:hypothetical protein
MSSNLFLAARMFKTSVLSVKPGRCASCIVFGVLLVAQAAGAPLTLNTEQNPALESSFTLDFGEYGGARTALISGTEFDLEIDPANANAQFLNYSQNVDPLTLPGGFSTGNIAITIDESLSGEFDRTTGVFTTNDVYAIHFDGDLSAYGIESPFILPGSASGVVSFDSVSTGYADMEWEGEAMLESPFRADKIVVKYTCSIRGVFTSFNNTMWIVSSDPAHGAIDARQPIMFIERPYVPLKDNRTREPGVTVSDPFYKERPAGVRSLTVTMNSPFLEVPTAGDFVAEQTWDGVRFEPGPEIRRAHLADPATLQLALGQSVEPGAWTVFTHQPSDTRFCLGYLPGDSNADTVTDTDDLAYLVECLAGRASCAVWQCDIDRSGTCDSGDVSRLMDLLNGDAPFDPWMYRSLAISPCE